jgi:hypothetical protein
LAQINAQSAVGNQTNPPYKTQRDYLIAASNAANVPLFAGEITKACQLCIVSAFAGSPTVAGQTSCGPALCGFSGAPGWTNMIKVGGNGLNIASATTAQACCLACVGDLNCAQWVFTGVCSHNVPPNQCVAATFTPFVEGGNIRCP